MIRYSSSSGDDIAVKLSLSWPIPDIFFSKLKEIAVCHSLGHPYARKRFWLPSSKCHVQSCKIYVLFVILYVFRFAVNLGSFKFDPISSILHCRKDSAYVEARVCGDVLFSRGRCTYFSWSGGQIGIVMLVLTYTMKNKTQSCLCIHLHDCNVVVQALPSTAKLRSEDSYYFSSGDPTIVNWPDLWWYE